MKDTYTNKAGLASGDTAAKSPIATQASTTSATPRAFETSEVEVSGNTIFLLNRLATGGPNNQYFRLHHRTLAERKVDTSLGRARLPASRNSHGMAEDQLAALARGQA